uniref:D-alanyl-glycyl endopeptidase n=1 Tax=Siphoviridae sp. cti6f5 TaxID=2826430 RepID=A0A8S5MCG7_9CAUD|nr:MAG TPA: Adenosylhomocysteinase [Siphoviridae sp. cti6f5]
MVVFSEALKFLKDGINQPHDFDGVYGAQCVDEVNRYLYKFWKIKLPGNAIDLLDSAKRQGMTVIYDAPGVNPKAGDVFVMSVPTHPYGHTGVVLEDSDGYTIKTIEQNIDGNADALTVGGPARLNERDFTGIIGWIRPEFETENSNGSYTEDTTYLRQTPQVGVAPYRQIHAHSTGNPTSKASGEATYMANKDLSSGFYTHVVGNGKVYQTAYVGQGAWDVGGGWNNETFAAVELIESHQTYEEFRADYEIYIQLLRDLANQAGIPITVDTDSLEGIKTHYYCTNNQPNNFSDHIDPYPYLAKWGISKEQFKKDVETGIIFNAPTKVELDVLDTNTNLENRDQPYYRGYLSEDYYLETEANANSTDKEFMPKGTEVYVYEKKNGWSRIGSHTSNQWLEDDYLVEASVF